MRNINWCSWTNTNTEKNINVSIAQRYPYYTRMEKIVVILHINGARAILLLLCDHQDTEYEEWVMDSGVAGPILTNKKIKGSMWQRYSYFTRWVKNIVEIIPIYGAWVIFLPCCYHQHTKYQWYEIKICVAGPKITPTISKALWTCSSPRRAVCSHSLVCSENSLLILGIGPILNK